MRINKNGQQSKFGDYDTDRLTEFETWLFQASAEVVASVVDALAGKQDRNKNEEAALKFARMLQKPGRLCTVKDGQRQVLSENFVPPAEQVKAGDFVIDTQTEDGKIDYYATKEIPEIWADVLGRRLEEATTGAKTAALPKGRLCQMGENGTVVVLNEDFAPDVEAYRRGDYWVDLQTKSGRPDWYLGIHGS